jgi:glycosyltransferase involved in cell wall biosynthesis
VKIAYVITRADAVGGASIHVRDLARAMLDRGHQTLVLLGGDGPVADQLAQAGVPFRPLRFLRRALHPLRDWRAVEEMTSALRYFGPDLVSTHTAKAGWVGRAACARLGIPALYTPHGWVIGSRISAASGMLFTAAERMAARWCRAIICVCEYEKRLAIEKRVAGPEILHVVHNGVCDIPSVQRAEPGRSPVRICSVARLESPKDHDTLLRALAALPSRDWKLDLVGDGPRESKIRRLAASLGIARHVDFLGYRTDAAEVLAASQLFVLSSRSEALPRSILEAMRAGLPVLAVDVGGVREAVAHGATGLLAPAGDVPALSYAIAELLSGPGLRQRLGAAGRQMFERRFRLERMIENTETVYAAVSDRTASARRIA